MAVSRILATLLGLMFISPIAVHGDTPPMVFGHLSVQDGLSQNTVLDVLQDSQGFVWIATEAGLNRYDGYDVRHYNQDRTNPDALRSDFVWEIAEDANGDLWLATKGGGLSRWERRHDRFVTYRHDPADPNSLGSDTVRSIFIDERGMVWAGTRDGGLSVLDPATGRFDRYTHNAEDPGSISDDTVFDIAADRAGNLWLGTPSGLNVMHVETGRFVHYRHADDDAHSISDDVVISVYQDSAGTIWAGTFKGGLNRFDSLNERFERLRHDPDDARTLSHDYVWAIEEDRDGRLWVGTQDGLNLYDKSTGEFTRQHKSATDPTSLGSSYVMSLHQDASGLLWVGTRGAGVSLWNPRSWSFGHHYNDTLKDAMVVSFAADGEGRVWVAALGAGLVRLDRTTGKFEDFSEVLGSGAALSDPRAMSLLLGRDGSLWVGTMTGGLNRVDLEKGTVEVFAHAEDNPQSLSANGVMSLFEDDRGKLWVGTYGGGLNRFERDSGTFERFEHDPNDPTSFSSPRATAIAQDREGRIWIGTDDAGLNLLDPQTGNIRHFRHDDGDSSTLSSDGIYALHVDRAGSVWVGTTDSGLDRVVGSPAAARGIRFENINRAHGLAGNVVYGVQSDLEGRLWLSGNNGLSVYDPETGVTKAFHRNHGLQGEEFNFGATHRGADGWLYFGGANGLNAFDPRALESASEPPNIALTGLEKFNVPAATDVPYPMIESVNLGYDDDIITFQFSALDFVAPENNLYSYRLEGFDRDWVQQSDRRRVTYTNLAAGDYVFRVKAANSDGLWNEEGLAIAVSVAAAPWETPLAYAIYVAAVVLLIASVFWWQRRRLQQAARIRQLAFYDALTGLPNSRLFRQRLSDAIADAGKAGDCLAVLNVDLDRFKRINDTLGHAVGDRVIKSVAARLSQCVHDRGSSIGQFELARLGGDEFLIFLRHRHAQSEAEAMAREIQLALAQPLPNGGQDLVVTASIGAATFPDHADSAEALLKAADTAMTQAKASGGQAFQLYSRRMSAQAMHRLSLENDIRAALEESQFQLYYQPKYRAGDLKIIGAEALLRWFHPTRGEISPGSFISVAEESGQITKLTRWVIGATCAQLHRWDAADLPVVPISVNISPDDFLRSDPVKEIAEATAHWGVSAAQLEVEITESALMRDTKAVNDALYALKDLGCGLSVDDFGTGYSSLAYLKRFPLDTIKIDRSFVTDMSSDTDDAAICSAIVAMARILGLKVVAEGVETDGQLRRLRADGCDQIQGFLLSRPVPADLFMELLLAQGPMADTMHELEEKVVQLVQP